MEKTAGTESGAPTTRWHAVLCKELPKLDSDSEQGSAREETATDEGTASATGFKAEVGADLPEQAEMSAEKAEALAKVTSATLADAGTGMEEMEAGVPAVAPHGPAVLCKALLRPNANCKPDNEAVSLALPSTGTAQVLQHPSHYPIPLLMPHTSPHALPIFQLALFSLTVLASSSGRVIRA